MKLTKAKLIKETKDKLNKLGYIQLKDTNSGSDGLYAKVIGDDLFLTLGLVISRYYDAKFTASFYLSKTTIWSAMWGDIPKDSYKRIGAFLTKEERKILLSSEDAQEGVNDAWWNDDAGSISSFITTVGITENRFLGQADLLDRIEKSSEVNKLAFFSSQVIKELNNVEDKYIYSFTPKKEVDGIPLRWFEAAERVLFKEKAILNINTVKRLAVDAWRQNYLKSTVNNP